MTVFMSHSSSLYWYTQALCSAVKHGADITPYTTGGPISRVGSTSFVGTFQGSRLFNRKDIAFTAGTAVHLQRVQLEVCPFGVPENKR